MIGLIRLHVVVPLQVSFNFVTHPCFLSQGIQDPFWSTPSHPEILL